jgi:hypothetical protein
MEITKIQKSRASQEIVPIKEIRGNVVVLKDGSLRMIIMVSSLNFALKSGEEQESIILQYQNFLNSLDFSVQFFVQSRSLNIEPYLQILKEREQKQTDELLKIQTREYIEFVREFVTATQIVNKTFFVVVPYTPTLLKTEGNRLLSFLDKFLKREKKPETMPQNQFQEHKLQLQQRADTIIQGLARTGIRATPLNTEELIELFYTLYNPGEGEKAKIPQL